MFWENHDPTQGMRQGNDVGHAVPLRHLLLTTTRSGARPRRHATRSSASCSTAGYGPITTEILPAPEFYYAEDYHQQYLAKNPGGYCGLGGTGVSCPAGVATTDRLVLSTAVQRVDHEPLVREQSNSS